MGISKGLKSRDSCKFSKERKADFFRLLPSADLITTTGDGSSGSSAEHVWLWTGSGAITGTGIVTRTSAHCPAKEDF